MKEIEQNEKNAPDKEPLEGSVNAGRPKTVSRRKTASKDLTTGENAPGVQEEKQPKQPVKTPKTVKTPVKKSGTVSPAAPSSSEDPDSKETEAKKSLRKSLTGKKTVVIHRENSLSGERATAVPVPPARIIEKITVTEPEDLPKEFTAVREEDVPYTAPPAPVLINPNEPPKNLSDLDSGLRAEGIIEVMPDGFGFIRSNGYLPGEDDVYVAPSQIKKFNLKTGDLIAGNKRVKGPNEKFSAILFLDTINGLSVLKHAKLTAFENLTPVFPHERLHLETAGGETSMRIVDLLCPIGKGQRGLIVAQPKVGKTTLLKQTASALLTNHPDVHIMILLIDERPEEVTDMQDSIQGDNVEILYSTFDELPEHHKRVSEMVIERAKRLCEMGRDVVILLDSITRLTRAYNLSCVPSGRTLSGGLDPAALYMPKRFFGAARCMKEGGSVTILATALQDTGSRLDDVVYEEFKGTGNMELVLNRKLSERRIFPAIDIPKSSTRRDDLLLSPEEAEAASLIHRVTTSGLRQEEAAEQVLDLFAATKTNEELCKKIRYIVF